MTIPPDRLSSKLLEIKNLFTAFHSNGRFRTVVDGVSLTINKNEVFAIVGEAGCGKSALALSIAQLHDVKTTKLTGEILFNGHDLLGFSESQLNRIRGKSIGTILQGNIGMLNPLQTIGTQVEEGLIYHTDLNKEIRKDRVLSLLNAVGLNDTEYIYTLFPHEASQEVRQRAMIAIAASSKPNLLIADEPTKDLDIISQAQILALLKSLQKETKSSLILTTRDLGIALEIADTIAIMKDGQIAECAPVAELLNNTQHAYTRSMLDFIYGKGE
ncbi:MAG: ABC transporter ATP-binding protein [Defluviitaleaceae bacterium]|nr:ABC transporter ATP-binding protein [Defluviitaleaceae bacterium]